MNSRRSMRPLFMRRNASWTFGWSESLGFFGDMMTAPPLSLCFLGALGLLADKRRHLSSTLMPSHGQRKFLTHQGDPIACHYSKPRVRRRQCTMSAERNRRPMKGQIPQGPGGPLPTFVVAMKRTIPCDMLSTRLANLIAEVSFVNRRAVELASAAAELDIRAVFALPPCGPRGSRNDTGKPLRSVMVDLLARRRQFFPCQGTSAMTGALRARPSADLDPFLGFRHDAGERRQELRLEDPAGQSCDTCRDAAELAATCYEGQVACQPRRRQHDAARPICRGRYVVEAEWRRDRPAQPGINHRDHTVRSVIGVTERYLETPPAQVELDLTTHRRALRVADEGK